MKSRVHRVAEISYCIFQRTIQMSRKKWDDGMPGEQAREHRKTFRAPVIEAIEYVLELGMTKTEFLKEVRDMWDSATEPEDDLEEDS